jgi:hypothetical protein
VNDVFASLNKWIKANKPTLNADKTNCVISYLQQNLCYLSIGYEEVGTTKFLGLQIDSNLNWKTHIFSTLCLK